MFLPVPAGSQISYHKARSTRLSEAGQPYQRYSGVSFWQGSITYEPQIDEGGKLASYLFGVLQLADQPGGFFFADLFTTADASLYTGTGSDAHRTLVDPDWMPLVGSDIARDFVILPTAEAKVGKIVSFRVKTQADFVTARIISKVEDYETDDEGNVIRKKATFNNNLPLEFTEAVGLKDYCLNRPHVRAIPLQDTASWTTHHHTMRPATFDWMEDTVGIVNALAGDAAGASSTYIVKEDGTTRITKEDGTLITK